MPRVDAVSGFACWASWQPERVVHSGETKRNSGAIWTSREHGRRGSGEKTVSPRSSRGTTRCACSQASFVVEGSAIEPSTAPPVGNLRSEQPVALSAAPCTTVTFTIPTGATATRTVRSSGPDGERRALEVLAPDLCSHLASSGGEEGLLTVEVEPRGPVQ